MNDKSLATNPTTQIKTNVCLSTDQVCQQPYTVKGNQADEKILLSYVQEALR